MPTKKDVIIKNMAFGAEGETLYVKECQDSDEQAASDVTSSTQFVLSKDFKDQRIVDGGVF